MKGTDLDKHDKEKAERDLLIQYYENYLKSESNASSQEVEKVREQYSLLVS